MNLPFILDIGIGLFSIYLTLSLFASELQELLTTVLQWRAQHLKQSIETLLAGESKPMLNQASAERQRVQAEIDRSKALANQLYNHPLIRSLDHESKGLIGRIAERVSQWTSASKTIFRKSQRTILSALRYFFYCFIRNVENWRNCSDAQRTETFNQVVDEKLVHPIVAFIQHFKASAKQMNRCSGHELQTVSN